MTTFLVWYGDDVQIASEQDVRKLVSEYLDRAGELREGADFSIRKADYFGPDSETIQRERLNGTTTGRFTSNRPAFEEI